MLAHLVGLKMSMTMSMSALSESGGQEIEGESSLYHVTVK